MGILYFIVVLIVLAFVFMFRLFWKNSKKGVLGSVQTYKKT